MLQGGNMNQNFEQFYLQTSSLVYGFFISRVSSKQDAEDLVADVYYKAFRNVNSETKLTKAWIFTIASNLLKNYYRNHKPMADIQENIKDVNEVEDVIISFENAKELITAVNKLSPDDQLLVSLRYFAQLPCRDISKVMNISVVAAKTCMSRCLVKLKELL